VNVRITNTKRNCHSHWPANCQWKRKSGKEDGDGLDLDIHSGKQT